ncbi:hypothetical protein [Thermoflavimicrobium dichotomicum]|uniref:Uncharacterized protein n=1 Tax=Thermoflavimicrobium dichotomicum TaxID=46223 RepID=A0A1I3MXK2_9BACL|nr:hypothetical protein [Thermoflavimicrobium dichotomicum]SFJ01691.1 hypothetical protein SAMN05421852_103244 [Thermoflavimicrobium dichotomicum]
MGKEQDIIQKLMQMRVGQIIVFSTKDPTEPLEVERIFVGKNPGWIIYFRGGREIIRELDKAVQFISQHWDFDLRSFLQKQLLDVGEIEDLGEF